MPQWYRLVGIAYIVGRYTRLRNCLLSYLQGYFTHSFGIKKGSFVSIRLSIFFPSTFVLVLNIISPINKASIFLLAVDLRNILYRY